MIAAQAAGRTFFGVEIDPLFVDVAIRRWQAFTGQAATRLSDGRKFDAVDIEIRSDKCAAEDPSPRG